ncbi:MAG: hypothetical protein KBC84_05930 [Proteobacteria bacterium]|nr:hypothetical protein [Pseudomonadota bacterium]
MKNILTLFISVALFSSCSFISSDKKKEIAEVSNKDLKASAEPPIIQIKQTFNLTSEQSAQAIVEMVEAAKMKVSSFDFSSGTIETDWVPLRDSVCGGHRTFNAPLSCRTKLMFKVTPINSFASSVHSTYKEFCNFNEDLNLQCPGSIPEQLILKINDNLKVVEKNVHPKGYGLLSLFE